MGQLRKSMKLLAHEKQALIDVYLRWQIPIDQYETRIDDLEALTAEWNRLTGRSATPQEVLMSMRTYRKRGMWVRFDGNHKVAPPPLALSAEDTEQLVGIFNENALLLESGSDVLAYEPEIADLIAKEFAAATGRIVPAHLLVAKLTALRKRGLLPKVESRPKVERGDDTGFEDINQIL